MGETDIISLQNAVVPLLVDPNQVEPFNHLNELRQWLIENIEWLIDNDFERMLSILYRIDVSEAKVRLLIEQNEGENAAAIIADLILERQAQKIESRKKYTSDLEGKYFDDDDVETWD